MPGAIQIPCASALLIVNADGMRQCGPHAPDKLELYPVGPPVYVVLDWPAAALRRTLSERTEATWPLPRTRGVRPKPPVL